MVDLWRDFWIRETGTGQEVDQLHDRYMMIMMMMIMWIKKYTYIYRKIVLKYAIQNVGYVVVILITFFTKLISNIFTHK